jgi:ketol-acid reductoisomerase
MIGSRPGLGLLIGLVSYTLLYLGKGVQKYAVEGIKESGNLRTKHSGTWLIGTAMTGLPVFIQWAALFFAPVRLIAPLEGFGLVVLLAFSMVILGERPGPAAFVGGVLIAVGTALIAYFSAGVTTGTGGPVLDPLWTRKLFLILLPIVAVEAVWIGIALWRRLPLIGIAFGVGAGTMMAFQTLSKRISAVPGAAVPAGIAAIIFAILTLVVTQFGFARAPASRVVPAFTSASILLAVLGGQVLLGEPVGPMQWLGIGIVVIGVLGLGAGGGKRVPEPAGAKSKNKETVMEAAVFFEEDASKMSVQGMRIGIIGYGNQGRSQALNMRDSGLSVIVGNPDDEYRKTALEDGFEVLDIEEASAEADALFLLLPDETLPEVFDAQIKPGLKEGALLCFASGYNIAFREIVPPESVDVVMIAPRMIGPGVRDCYLRGEGFFSFISVHQDGTGKARERLLGLALCVGALKKGGIEITMKQEAVLDLFNEQAFGPAFGRVLLTSVDTLLKNGMPPEAVLVEMYLSGEMAYTYEKMATYGIVKQLKYHSHTSQYGALSRGARYIGLPLKKKFQKTFNEINSGDFAEEWGKKRAKLKLKVLKRFASRQKIGEIEEKVRRKLRFPSSE